MKKILAVLIVVVLFSFLFGCINPEQESKGVGVLSPAVIDCRKNSGTYEVVNLSSGAQSGRCVLHNSVCSDENYYQKGCYENQIVVPSDKN